MRYTTSDAMDKELEADTLPRIDRIMRPYPPSLQTHRHPIQEELHGQGHEHHAHELLHRDQTASGQQPDEKCGTEEDQEGGSPGQHRGGEQAEEPLRFGGGEEQQDRQQRGAGDEGHRQGNEKRLALQLRLGLAVPGGKDQAQRDEEQNDPAGDAEGFLSKSR